MVPLPFTIKPVALRPGRCWEGQQAWEGGSLSGKRGQPPSHKHMGLFISQSGSLSRLWGPPRRCQPGSGSCTVPPPHMDRAVMQPPLLLESPWEQRASRGAAAQEPSLRLLPAKGQLQLCDFTSWVTLCSRCNAITITDVSAITARAA